MSSVDAVAVTFSKRATALGHYYTGRGGAAALRAALAGCALARFKTAAIGGEQEQGFEQAFSSLGYTYLKDKAPRLLDFIVGFQLVDRNEDNTKAMGVFGFKVGDLWLYAPIFFLSGDFKGHELLYVKQQDMFVPLKENWVNYLIGRRPHLLGQGSAKNTHQLGGMMPDITRLSYPPVGLKFGGDVGAVQSWALPFLPVAAALADGRALALYAAAPPGARLDLRKVAAAPVRAAVAAGGLDLAAALCADFGLLKTAYERCYLRYPLLKRGFDAFHGQDFFARAGAACLARARGRDKEAASYLLPPRPRRRGKFHSANDVRRQAYSGAADDALLPDRDYQDREERLHKLKQAVTLAVADDAAVRTNLPELDDAQREKLLHDGVLIKDERDPHAKSVAYDTQLQVTLTNPDDTGLFEVLERPGHFDDMLVVRHPQAGNGRQKFVVVVRKGDPRAWLSTHATNVYARAQKAPDEFRSWLDGLGTTADLQVGGTYLALHERGSGTCPFVVREDYGGGAYEVEWKDYCQFGRDRPRFLPKVDAGPGHDPFDDGYSSYRAKVYVNKVKGSKLRSVRGELSIPEDYKILKIADPPRPAKEDGGYLLGGPPSWDKDPAGSDPKPIEPGDLADVQLFLQKSAQVKLYDTGGGEVWLGSQLGQERMSKRAALLALVRDHGLDEGQARLMLKEAARLGPTGRRARYFVKYADDYPSWLNRGPDAPPFVDPPRGAEPVGRSSYPAVYPQEQFEPVSGLDSHATDPSVYDPFYQPDQGAMRVAQQAAESGQKEVFDTSMFAGLIKSMGKERIDKHFGPLMKCVDALGRLLVLFYYHQEDFKERYGGDELPEIEDSLRNTFEAVGDVALELRAHSAEGQHGLSENAPAEGDPGPNIDEIARQ